MCITRNKQNVELQRDNRSTQIIKWSVPSSCFKDTVHLSSVTKRLLDHTKRLNGMLIYHQSQRSSYSSTQRGWAAEKQTMALLHKEWSRTSFLPDSLFVLCLFTSCLHVIVFVTGYRIIRDIMWKIIPSREYFFFMERGAQPRATKSLLKKSPLSAGL